MFRLALYQPEIAANLGACIRIAACFGVPLDVVEPCGFPWRDRDIGRVALDYNATLLRHRDWSAFKEAHSGRVILMSTSAEMAYDRFAFGKGDIILMGNESSGVPDFVHAGADARLRIPLAPAARSLNLAVASGLALAEASRQTGRFR